MKTLTSVFVRLGVGSAFYAWSACHAVAQPLPAYERLAADVSAHYPAILARQAGVTEAEANVDVARRQFLPTPTVQYNSNSNGNNTSTPSLTVGISQPVWTFGRLTAGLDAARERNRTATESLQETRNSILLHFTELYQSYLAARGRMAAQRAGLNRLQGMNDMMTRRLEGGVSAKVDGDLSRSRLAQAGSDLAQENALQRSLLAQLEQLAGRPIRPAEIPESTPDPDATDPSGSLTDRALARHPTLLKAQATLDTARADARQQRAAQWPTLALQVSHQSYHRPQPGTSTTNQVFLSVQYQPGAGLASTAAVRAADAQVTAAQDTLEASRRDIVTALVADVENYRMALERRPDVEQTVRSSEAVLASYQRLFVAGKRSWLDVVNAARELTQAEVAMADLRAQLLMAPYRLKLRTGDEPWN